MTTSVPQFQGLGSNEARTKKSCERNVTGAAGRVLCRPQTHTGPEVPPRAWGLDLRTVPRLREAGRAGQTRSHKSERESWTLQILLWGPAEAIAEVSQPAPGWAPSKRLQTSVTQPLSPLPAPPKPSPGPGESIAAGLMKAHVWARILVWLFQSNLDFE